MRKHKTTKQLLKEGLTDAWPWGLAALVLAGVYLVLKWSGWGQI